MRKAEKHPFFDLWLHTTDVLEELLGGTIATQETIHDWPLSSVQRLVIVDGCRLIYKVQNKATVEREFYRRAMFYAAARAPLSGQGERL